MQQDSKHIIQAITQVCGHKRPLVLHEPEFNHEDEQAVLKCIRSGWVSTAGEQIVQFEKKLAEFTGSQYAIATTNGTSALHICLILNGVTEHTEVLMQSMTFVATANAVRYCGAIPHFVDIEEQSLGIDCFKLRQYLEQNTSLNDKGQLLNKHSGRTITALIVMHSFGQPSNMNELVQLAEDFHLNLIEDAAESLGSFYQSKHTGSFGKMAAISFNGNKIISCGGGGAILTQDENLAYQAKQLTTTAKIAHQYAIEHEQTAYNYRLPNLNASLALSQLSRLAQFIENKRKLAKKYQQVFINSTVAKIYQELPTNQSNYWLNLLILNKIDINYRNSLIENCIAQDIFVRPAWGLMHHQPMYQNMPKMDDLSVCERLTQQIICLPSSVALYHE